MKNLHPKLPATDHPVDEIIDVGSVADPVDEIIDAGSVADPVDEIIDAGELSLERGKDLSDG